MYSRRDFMKTAGLSVAAVPGVALPCPATADAALPVLRPNVPTAAQQAVIDRVCAVAFADKHTAPKVSRQGYAQNNILLITSDQQHFMTMGYNNPAVKTPNLDRLAARGMIFDRAYTVNPTCTPTRASLITGKYPSQHGAWSLGTSLAPSEPCIGDDFARAGYRTALVGKAHFQPLQGTLEHPSLEAYPVLQDLDFWREFDGPFYGFEHVELARNHVDEAHVGQHYALWMEEKGGKDCWRDWFRIPTGTHDIQYGVWNIPEEYHYNAWISERTNALMAQYADENRPFFLWASYFDPHPPYLLPEPWASMYNPDDIEIPVFDEQGMDDMPIHYRLTREKNPGREYKDLYQEHGGNGCHGFHVHKRSAAELRKDIAYYYGMISMMDHYIGKTLDQVEALRIADTTLIVFTTDHGHYYGQHGLYAKGAFHFDDGIRVPLIASLPGSIPEGRRSAALQSLVDLPPTFFTFSGIDHPWHFAGVDQYEVWRGEKERTRDHVIVENHHQPTTIHQKTYINDRYKVTIYCNQTYGELFDLKEDPGEERNLWDVAEYSELKNELLVKFLHGELAKESIPMPRIAGA